MKKFLSAFLLFTLLGTAILPSKADTIVTPNGSVLKGKINYVLETFVEISTKDGNKKIYRESLNGAYTDIVDVGFFHRKKIVGFVKYADDDYVDVVTPEGKLRLKRLKVRDIILSQ